MPVVRKQSQKEKVIKYLREGNSITPIKAMHMFGCMRLADVIFKLKADGHKIQTNLRRDPENKSYARYSLKAAPVVMPEVHSHKTPHGLRYSVDGRGNVINVFRG